jgi:hypothetical protein
MCLRGWLAIKLKEKESALYTHLVYKNLTCEVCLQPLPSIIFLGN